MLVSFYDTHCNGQACAKEFCVLQLFCETEGIVNTRYLDRN